MAERCTAIISFGVADLEDFRQGLDLGGDHYEESNVVEYVLQGFSSFEALARMATEKKKSFWGTHTACIGAYDAMAFAGYDGEFAECAYLDMAGCPVVGVSEDGSLSSGDIRAARAYLLTKNRAKKAIGIEE